MFFKYGNSSPIGYRISYLAAFLAVSGSVATYLMAGNITWRTFFGLMLAVYYFWRAEKLRRQYEKNADL